MVTERIKPLLIHGKVVHQIGLPFHWSFAGESVGGQANDLTALIADPNVSMHEGKVFACDVAAGIVKEIEPRPTKEFAPWPTRESSPQTPRSAQPEGLMKE
jgi:formate dehydrogenase major subunit